MKEQIRQMANDLQKAEHWYYDEISCTAELDEQKTAKNLYEAGYRKQREGHWFILEYEYFTCSECGYYHGNGCDSTQEAKEKLAEGKVPKYCSDCGAKMKGGGKE